MQKKHYSQKILALLLILIVPAFILKNFPLLLSKRDLSCSFCTDFVPKEEYLTDKSFVFILYGKADQKTCEQCLSSIFHQKYDLYRVLCIIPKEIHSTISLKQLAAKEEKEDRLIFLEMDENVTLMDTFRLAIESCKNEEIIVQLEDFDWLAHENVLTKLNQIYSQSTDVWLTYSQYLEYPSYKRGDMQPYVKKMLRNRYKQKAPWLSSHLKTYYAGLFKKLNIDLRSPYYKEMQDGHLEAVMIPLVEHAKHHIRFIDDALYIHTPRPS